MHRDPPLWAVGVWWPSRPRHFVRPIPLHGPAPKPNRQLLRGHGARPRSFGDAVAPLSTHGTTILSPNPPPAARPSSNGPTQNANALFIQSIPTQLSQARPPRPRLAPRPHPGALHLDVLHQGMGSGTEQQIVGAKRAMAAAGARGSVAGDGLHGTWVQSRTATQPIIRGRSARTSRPLRLQRCLCRCPMPLSTTGGG